MLFSVLVKNLVSVCAIDEELVSKNYQENPDKNPEKIMILLYIFP